MDFDTRPLVRLLCLPALCLACQLPVQAEPLAASGTSSQMTAAAAPTKPASKSRHKKAPRYSKATIAAFQPDPERLIAKPDTTPDPSANAATLLSPVVQKRPVMTGPEADPLPTAVEPETPIAKKLMEAGQATKVVSKTRQLPSQEEGLAIARSTSVPVAEDASVGVSEEAEAKVEKGVETGPMNLRGKKQALQMSVEIPLGSP